MALNDELANDRTYLAWLRTGIALFGLGVVIAKIALIVNANDIKVHHEAFYAAVGIVSVLCGAVLVGVGYVQHRRVRRGLVEAGDGPGPRWPLATTAAAVGGALLLCVLLAVSA